MQEDCPKGSPRLLYDAYLHSRRKILLFGSLLFVLYAFNTFKMLILSPQDCVISACCCKDNAMLSAIASFSSLEICAAWMAICRSRSMMMPSDIISMASRARSSPNSCKTRLNTSYKKMVGISNFSESIIERSKKLAFLSSAMYSIQPDESTDD